MQHSHSVLIVEDDPAIRDVYVELLASEGHAVSQAAHGEEAMGMLLDGTRPCVIVADLLMPILDGWGLAARLATEPRLASIPLVVLSAQAPSDSRDTPRGARARLTKPVVLDELVATVERYCRDGRSANERTDVAAAP
ncbi:MAG: response regulator [Chloroflexota bacterium]